MATYKIDNKRRLTIPGATPGEVYDVEHIGGGHYRLARMRVEPRPEESTEQVEETPDPGND